MSQKFYPQLQEYVSGLENEFDQIPDLRKKELAEIGTYIRENADADLSFTVICTHNSRRSHMGQLWLKAAAEYYDIEKLKTYSGGTEATAFNPRAVRALSDAGFDIQKRSDGENPQYVARYADNGESMTMFSKKFDDQANPTSAFAAIMVCSSADEACPIVPGADARFSIPFDDPKAADGTEQEAEAYAKTCRMIAREMFYAVNSSRTAKP